MSISNHIVMLSFLLGLVSCASPATYTLQSVEGWVIDTDTKQAVEGALVIAHWVLEDDTHIGGIRSLAVFDSITDRTGYYRVSGVGPFHFPKSLRLTYMAPELLIFKGGYEYRQLLNQTNEIFDTGMPFYIIRSDWNQKTIGINPFKDAMDVYKRRFNLLNSTIERIAIDNSDMWCGWKRIPNAIRVMNHERQRLIAHGVNPSDILSIDKRLLVHSDDFAKEIGCGSPREFFKDIQQ